MKNLKFEVVLGAGAHNFRGGLNFEAAVDQVAQLLDFAHHATVRSVGRP